MAFPISGSSAVDSEVAGFGDHHRLERAISVAHL
jgi:hypothetical protein